MKISSKTHYGLQAAYILAREGGSVSAKVLEKEIGVSSKYLERIMRIMTAANIVSANRGVQGGYFVARKPDEITVGEIVGNKIDRYAQGVFDIQPQSAELEQGHDAAFFNFQIHIAVAACRASGI